MKRCPKCNRIETDDGLAFCRVDGMPLTRDSGAASAEAKTAKINAAPALNEAETSVLPPPATTPEIPRPTKPTTVPPAPPTRGTTPEATKPKRLGFLIAMIALVVITVAVIGYFYRTRKEVAAIASIAVLPFVNQNNDPNIEYLSDGIPESIINSLSQLPNLKVMSRNSVFRYKGKEVNAQAIAKELNVQALLTGRVVQHGDALAISVELINAQDNSQIWGQQYNRKLADVFAVQEEIAREISEKLRVKLTGTPQKQFAKRPTENLKAFQYYMQGRVFAHRRTREDLLTAISFCEKAIAEDGNYALAYAGLADAYANLGVRNFIDPSEGRRKADEAARKALALDENLGEGHFALSQSNTLFAPYDLQLVNRELKRALELSPSLAVAHQYLGISLAIQGQFDQSLDEFLKARELDPLSSSIARGSAFPYYLRRDYPRALEILRRANELGPPFSVFWEVEAYTRSGLFDEASMELEKAKKERRTDQVLIFSEGMIYAEQGKRTEALRIVKELEGMSTAGVNQAEYLTRLYLALGDKDQSLKWLNNGLATGALTGFYPHDPFWDPLRSDERFADLLRRVGLPQ